MLSVDDKTPQAKPVTLHVQRRGKGDLLVVAHGFTQNANCWGAFGEGLAEHFDVLMVDAPGHGRSGHDDADLWEAGKLLMEAGGRAHYLGYSMGGRMLLHGALQRSHLVRSLTLIGATAGIEDAETRAGRRRADDELAAKLETAGLPSFIDSWLSLPLFATLPKDAARRDERLRNRAAGLAASLRNCGTGTQEPLWNRLDEMAFPTLVLAGAQDSKFSQIGRRLAAALPSGRFAQVAGGHAVHAERPAEVAELVTQFVQSVES